MSADVGSEGHSGHAEGGSAVKVRAPGVLLYERQDPDHTRSSRKRLERREKPPLAAEVVEAAARDGYALKQSDPAEGGPWRWLTHPRERPPHHGPPEGETSGQTRTSPCRIPSSLLWMASPCFAGA